MISSKHYYKIRTENYVIRDAPVEPGELLEPVLPNAKELADHIARIFPDTPKITDYVAQHGAKALSNIQSVEAAMETFAIDRIEAHRLLSVLNIGQTLYAPGAGSIPLIRSIEDVYKHCYTLTSRQHENLHVLLVNNRYQLVHEQTVAIGTAQGLNVTPRDVIQVVLQREVPAFVLVHNHPSGDPTPSEADYLFSQEVQKAAAYFNLELLDHVIVATSGSASALRQKK
jgi:DNA repair protein RadC